MQVLGNVATIAITWPFRHFWRRFGAKIFSSLCTISACILADNATFHRVLLGLSTEGYLLGDFRNISIGPPFALFRKCGFKLVCTLSAYQLEVNAICARVHLGISNDGYVLGHFWKISLAGFGWPCQNCNNLAIRAVLEHLFGIKIFVSLCRLSAHLLEDNAVCGRVLLGDFWKVSLGPPLHFFRKCRFKFVCTLSAYQLEDNAICARV